MFSSKTIFWGVDTQADFMLPGGKLYVPGAEKIIPNVARLVGAARQDCVFLISSADAHDPEDPELQEWAPHCIKGTPGAELIPEARAVRRFVIPNSEGFKIPPDVSAYQQVILQKNTLDVFDNPNMDVFLARLNPKGSPPFDPDADFVVFGVAAECCVRCAADGLLRRGRRVALITDAIQSLDLDKGRQSLDDLQARGARLLRAEQALALVVPSFARSA